MNKCSLSKPAVCCDVTHRVIQGHNLDFSVVSITSVSSPGSKAMDYSNGLFDCQSPTSPFLGGLRVLHLLEDLRGALELMDNEERDNLRCQIPDSTAEGLAEWLQGRLVKHLHIYSLTVSSSCLFGLCGGRRRSSYRKGS